MAGDQIEEPLEEGGAYIETQADVGITQDDKIGAARSLGLESNAWRREMVAGTGAGWVGKVFEYPFDTLKVQMQLNPQGYSGPIDCLTKTIRKGGFVGLYRGLSPPLLGAGIENSIAFSTYSTACRWYRSFLDERDGNDQMGAHPSMKAVLLAGASSGAVVSLWMTPIELLKCRLQASIANQPHMPRSIGPVACALQAIREEGFVRGMYRGHMATTLREVPGSAAYFGSYETFARLITKYRSDSQDVTQTINHAHKRLQSTILMAGMMAGTSYWMLIYPIDTLKSRVQVARASSNLSLFDAMLRCWRNEPLRMLYRGMGVTLLRAGPSNAVVFYTYEMISRFLKEKSI